MLVCFLFFNEYLKTGLGDYTLSEAESSILNVEIDSYLDMVSYLFFPAATLLINFFSCSLSLFQVLNNF